MSCSPDKKHSLIKPERWRITDYSFKMISKKRQTFFRSNNLDTVYKDSMKNTQSFGKIQFKNDFICRPAQPKQPNEKTQRKKEHLIYKRTSVQKSPYISDPSSLQKMMRLLVPVRGPNQSLKLSIKKHNEMNMKNAELMIMKKAENFEDRMKAYTSRLGLPEETKLFVMNSRDTHIKQALLRRGWVQCLEKQTTLYHLKWVYKDAPGDYVLLQDQQFYNHFKNNEELTNKNYLQKNIKNMSPNQRPKFPLSFDLGLHDDNAIFHQKYSQFEVLKTINKIGTTIARLYPSSFERLLKKKQLFMGSENHEKRHKHSTKNENYQLLYNSSLKELESSKSLWQTLSALYQLVSLAAEFVTKQTQLQYSLFYPNHAVKDLFSIKRIVEDQILFGAQDFFANLSPFYLNEILKLWQRCLNINRGYGLQNMWILKPNGVSRGTGICITNDLSKINSLRHGKIIQKYIENPLLLECKRKFDIRQWVLVTSFAPLQAYIFRKCYGRFSSVKYSNNKHQNMQKHLTNYSQNKDSYMKQKLTIKENTCFGFNYSSVMSEEDLAKQIGPHWKQIKKQMCRSIYRTLSCCEQQITNKQGCFEVYGFDILLDQQYQPYVLEVNMSPACEHREFLGEYLFEMAEGLVDLFEGGSPTNWMKLVPESAENKKKNLIIAQNLLAKLVMIQRWWRKKRNNVKCEKHP